MSDFLRDKLFLQQLCAIAELEDKRLQLNKPRIACSRKEM